MRSVRSHTTTLLPSAARTSNGTGDLINVDLAGTGRCDSALFHLDVTAVSGVAPTLDCFIQVPMPDGGYGDVVAFSTVEHVTKRIAGVEPASFEASPTDGTLTPGTVRSFPLPTSFRVKWVIGGTDPSFTFAVTTTVYL